MCSVYVRASEEKETPQTECFGNCAFQGGGHRTGRPRSDKTPLSDVSQLSHLDTAHLFHKGCVRKIALGHPSEFAVFNSNAQESLAIPGKPY